MTKFWTAFTLLLRPLLLSFNVVPLIKGVRVVGRSQEKGGRGGAAITVYVGTFPDRLLRCYPYRGDAVIAMISDESLVVIDRLMASDLFW